MATLVILFEKLKIQLYKLISAQGMAANGNRTHDLPNFQILIDIVKKTCEFDAWFVLKCFSMSLAH